MLHRNTLMTHRNNWELWHRSNTLRPYGPVACKDQRGEPRLIETSGDICLYLELTTDCALPQLASLKKIII